MKLSKEELHAIRNELVMLGEAAVLACLRIEGPGSGFSLAVLNLYAQALSRRAAVYSLSEDLEQFRVLAPGELEGGKFADGGRELVFRDGREKITRLALLRRELHAAIDALRRINKDSGLKLGEEPGSAD